jgi:hypothetical protein
MLTSILFDYFYLILFIHSLNYHHSLQTQGQTNYKSKTKRRIRKERTTDIYNSCRVYDARPVTIFYFF